MAESPASAYRNLAAICLSGAGWAFGFGLGAPVSSLWLRDGAAANTPSGLADAATWPGLDTIIGLNTSVYYLGIALAAGLVPGLMRRWGRGCLLLGLVVSGLAIAWLPWSGPLWFWLLLRFANGVAGAMSLIPLETLVNRQALPAQRARHFGFYAFAVALGWALGNLVGLQLYAETPRLALVLGGIVGVVAGLLPLIGLTWPAELPEEPRRPLAIPLKANFLSFGSAWSQGFLEGGMVAFLAMYLLTLGLVETEVSWLTSGIMIGVILFQIPVAWLADRLGRTAVLIGCYAVTAVGLAYLPFGTANSVWFRVWLFLVGACSGSFYPLGLAILGARLPESHLARANAWYLAMNCCGSLIGPVASGILMDHWGKPALFVGGEVAVLAVLIAWLVIRWQAANKGGYAGIQKAAFSGEDTREAA